MTTVTTSVGPSPALPTVAAAPPTGPPDLVPGDGSSPVAAVVTQLVECAASPAAFSALLLGLSAAAGTGAPAATTPGAAPAGPAEPPGDVAAAEPVFTLPALGSTPEISLTSDPASGKPTGDPLPASGTDLPPPDVSALLASLGIPGNAAAAAMAAPTPAVNAGQTDAGDPAVSPAAAQNPDASAIQAAPQGAKAKLALLQLQEQARSAADGTTNAVAGQDDASAATLPAEATLPADKALPGASTSAMAAHVPQPALPAEFRAGLETLMAAAQRPASPLDSGTISLGGLAAGTAPPAHSSPGNVGTPANGLDSLPALQPLGNQNAWSQSLGDRVLMMADKGLQSATIKLQPEHLGPMQIQIQVDENGSAQVLFSAHHAQTRDALENAIPRLRDLFTEQGMSLMQANVDSGRNAFAHRDFGGTVNTWRGWGSDEPEAAVAQNPAVYHVSRGSSQHVDIFV